MPAPAFTAARALRLPSRTVRLRLTLFYSSLFLVSGAALLAITYLLVRHASEPRVVVKGGDPSGRRQLTGSAASRLLSTPSLAHHLSSAARHAHAQAFHDHAAELHQLLVQSGIALAIMTVASIALGWLVAGRVLRPLRTMTATTRQISERNLHERLALDGPADELKDLADTVDGLLARLEAAFGAQRRFVANAAHELRTPLTLLRALLEETLTDPSASLESFRATSKRLLALGQDQERLLEALLALASSERGLDRREPFDLAEIADTILLEPHPELGHPRIDAEIESAPTTGDAALAERLVGNLIDNAIRHNLPGGRVRVSTGIRHGHACLTVSNAGPVIPAAEVGRLFEPFQRLGTDRAARADGHHGLGLSIVRAIATAHDAGISAQAQPGGGLAVEVSFPLDPAHSGAVPPGVPAAVPASSGVGPALHSGLRSR